MTLNAATSPLEPRLLSISGVYLRSTPKVVCRKQNENKQDDNAQKINLGETGSLTAGKKMSSSDPATNSFNDLEQTPERIHFRSHYR